MSRVAIEVMGGHGSIDITGELTTTAYVDMRAIAKKIAGPNYGIKVNVVTQSPDIANGVDTGGAGDQGIMVGYACRENEDYIPLELYYARSLCRYIYEKHPFDGKTQVTINDKGEVQTLVASFQKIKKFDLNKIILEWSVVTHLRITKDFIVHANPAGDWEIGGFEADTGLTGRKIIVDAYGPQIAVGGGAFSGKDATKVDRSGAYMARKIAVDLLKRLEAKEVMVKIAYAIGVAKPVMATAWVDGQAFDFLNDSWEITSKDYDLTPLGIINFLELRKPQFEKTAEWGHFGNSFPWDK